MALGFCFVSVCASVSHAETFRCETLFPAAGDIHLQPSSEFRAIPGEPFLSFRGSVAHFWKRLRQEAATGKARILLSYLGLVVGDFHPGNWGDIELKNQKELRKTGLIDLDDVGIRGALIGDFLRGAIGVELSGISISHEALWKAYVEGLKGDRVEKPERLEKIQKKDMGDFDKRQKEYMQGLLNETGSKFKAGGQILLLNEAPFLARHLYQSLESRFKVFFLQFNVLDVGFRMKQVGGSQRLPRYIFLLEHAVTGKKHVVEAKYLVTPGTNEFANQGSHRQRIQVAGNLYRPKGYPVGFYDVLETPEHTFQIRERFDNFLNLDPIKMQMKITQEKLTPDELQKTLLYIFNQMGRFQGRQDIAAALIAAIDRNPDITRNGVNDFIQNYVQEARQLSIAPVEAK